MSSNESGRGRDGKGSNKNQRPRKTISRNTGGPDRRPVRMGSSSVPDMGKPGEDRQDRPRPEGGYQKRDGDFKKPYNSDRPRTEGGYSKDAPYKKDGAYQKTFKKFKKPGGRNAEDLQSTDGTMRLNRFLAISGIASRRDADELIRTGLVMVNNKTVIEMGYKVLPTDEVKYNGERLKAEKKIYLLLNKPKGYITTVEDPKARKTVMEIINHLGPERFYPVGRLDRGTTGVLLFTNDGDLAKKLTHPSHGAKKIYQVTLDKNVTQSDISKIGAGLELEDGIAEVDAVSYVDEKSKNTVGLEIHSGKNRIVRRIFESLGYEVEKLDRVMFAGLTKKNLARGQWRYLSQQEVNFLQLV